MNLLMSDTPLPVTLPGTCRYVDLSKLTIANCMGCFGCWVKTPGSCVLRDDAVKVYPLIAKSTNLLYVSRIKYGSYDVTMKTMLERASPIQQAFIRVHQGETHHVQRAVEKKQAVIVAYGAQSQEEKRLFERLVERNARNMQFWSHRVRFVCEEDLFAAVEQEVAKWDDC